MDYRGVLPDGPESALSATGSDLVSIAEAVWPATVEPKVTVFVAAFNHGPYIRQCLESILAQKVPFRVQVLVHDDASTDDTAEIIRAFEARYPSAIQAVCQSVNQYTQGRDSDDFLLPLTRGNFIAICEGDDYWIDEHKLAMQVEAIEACPGCDICIHKGILINSETGQESPFGAYGEEDRIVPVEEIIRKKHGQVPTASILIRRSVLQLMHAFTSARPWLTVGDIYIQFFGAKRGGALYINKVMSAYRYLVPGSWNSRMANDPSAWISHVRTAVDSYLELDRMSGHAFREAFDGAIRSWLDYIFWSDDRSGYLDRVSMYVRYRQMLPTRYILFLLPHPVVQAFARFRRRFVGRLANDVLAKE